MKKVLLAVLSAGLACASFASPYVAVRGTAARMTSDINQWQYAPSMGAPTQGEFSVIEDGRGHDTSAGVQIAAGMTLNSNLRAELEYAYNGDVKAEDNFDYHINSYTLPTHYQLKTTIQTLGINVYYDFHNQTLFTPYVGFGVGIAGIREKAYVQNSVARMEDQDYYYAMTWNVNAGVAYAITERLTADLGVRYSALGSKETTQYGGADNYNSSARREYSSFQGSLGLRYSF